MKHAALLALLSLPCLAEELRFEPVLGNTELEKGAMWLFVVEDSEGRLVASCERGQRLHVGVLDLSGRAPRVEWKGVAGAKEGGGDAVADHWHVFAHGRHWLSYSTPGARRSHLIALDDRLECVSSWVVADDEKAGRGGILTNDHFLVAEPDGVAVGHFFPGQGHRVFRISKDGTPRGEVDIGSGEFRHANGSSANPIAGGFALWASATLAPNQSGWVRWIEFDADWSPRTVQATIEKKGANLSMPSAVKLASGTWVVHLREIDGAAGGPPPKPGPGGAQPRDMGDIVRYLVGADGKVGTREVIADVECARPHTLLVGDRLITTWDGDGGAWIRVDRVK